MKRTLFLLTLMVLVIAGCSSSDSSSGESQLTLQDFIKAYQDQGVEVDPSEKPLFEMLGAKDGVIFYMENSPVKIYEFDSVKSLKKAVSEDGMIKDWPQNGRFLLETKKQEAIQIFENVK